MVVLAVGLFVYGSYSYCSWCSWIVYLVAALAATNNAKKKVMFKNCTPFTKCTSKINNIQVDDAHNIDAIMVMYSLIECSPIYSKIGSSM